LEVTGRWLKALRVIEVAIWNEFSKSLGVRYQDKQGDIVIEKLEMLEE
jgi:hypothetical protein